LYCFEVFHGVVGVAVEIAVRMPFGKTHFKSAPLSYKLFGSSCGGGGCGSGSGRRLRSRRGYFIIVFTARDRKKSNKY
jgi:hypothetical protein